MTQTPDEVRNFLKKLSPQDFLKVGLNQIAYIRPVQDGADTYSVHAADGTEIVTLDSMDLAIATIQCNDLHAVTVH